MWIGVQIERAACYLSNCGYIDLMAKINSRQKGANGEREFAAVLQKVVNEVALLCGYVPPTIRRNTEQSQIGGEDLTGLPWYSFEIKRCERVELDKWWQQTCTQAARKASGIEGSLRPQSCRQGTPTCLGGTYDLIAWRKGSGHHEL